MKVRLKSKILARKVARSRLSQNRWAQKLGLRRGHFSQLVNGLRLYPNPETRRKLLKGFSLSFDDLFELERPRLRPKSDSRSVNGLEAGTRKRRMPMRDFCSDLRYGFRVLFKNPAFTGVTVLVLALGIGLNTTIYSLLSGVLLRPLPFEEPERLVAVWERERGDNRNSISPANYLDWRDQNTSFERIAAWHLEQVVLSNVEEPERVLTANVSADFFPALKVDPQIGRLIAPEEETPGKDRVVLLSHGFWQRRHGADPAIEGKSLTLDGNPHTVIGVLPPQLEFPEDVELFVPLAFDFDVADSRGAHFLRAIARLKPGVSLDRAQLDMDVIARRLEQEYPDKNTGLGVTLLPLQEDLVENVRRPILVLQGAVSLILLITCANVANMLLARTGRRRKETALRMALGAARTRIARQLLTESLLLSFTGGAVGVLFALGGLGFLPSILPSNLPRIDNIGLDAPVLGVAFLVACLTGLLVGLAPIRQASRTDLQSALSETATGGRQQLRLRSALVVTEVALAVVLVFGASLLMHSFWRLQSVDPGFRTEQALTTRIALPKANYPEGNQVVSFFERLLSNIERDPRVKSAEAVAWLPPGGTWFFSFEIDGRPPASPGEGFSGSFRPVTPGYFQAMGIPLVKGRLFGERDDESAPLAIIVNETLARRHFPNQDPIGKRMRIGYGRGESPLREIVGVVADIKQFGLAGRTPPAYYLPHRQLPFNQMSLVIKTRSDPLDLAPIVRREVRELDPNLALSGFQSLEERLHGSLARPRFLMLLCGSFAFLALLLACLGVYGVLAQAVLSRRPEIGVRLALGAARRDVLRLFLRQGAGLIALGLMLGGLGSWAVNGLMAPLLFSITPGDPLTIVAVICLLVIVGLLASYIPARRATRFDPMHVLRYD